jgi:hypothetical protein
MQVGDLVELSAYGKKLKGYKALRDHHGIVIEDSRRGSYCHGWKIHWFGKSVTIMDRRNIKHV